MSSPDCIVMEAFAKVNLSLDITGTAPGGYHAIETVMHSIGLRDLLIIGRRREAGVRVTCSEPGIPEDSGNIAYLAAAEFLKATGLGEQGLSIHIDKLIPAEAGLGGGSADAAAVILGLDRLFETRLSPEQLKEIGLKSGMDVPFCLTGGCALAEGRGEVLTPQPALPGCRLVVAKPDRGMSTKRAYALYDGHGGRIERPDNRRMLSCLAAGDLAGVGANMINVFDGLDETGETAILRGIMRRAGALGSALSGSGSAVIGLFADEGAADDCLRPLTERGCRCWAVSPVDTGVRTVYAG